MESQLVLQESAVAAVSRLGNSRLQRDSLAPIDKFSKKQFLEDKRECGRLIIASKLTTQYTEQLAASMKKKQQHIGNRLTAAQEQFRDFEESLATKSARIQQAESEANRLFHHRLSLEDELGRLNFDDSVIKSDIADLTMMLEEKASILHFYHVSNLNKLPVTEWGDMLSYHITSLSEAVLFLIRDTEDNRVSIEAGERKIRLAAHLSTFKTSSNLPSGQPAPVDSVAAQIERDKKEISRLERSIESTKQQIAHLSQGVARLYGICNGQAETVSSAALVDGQLGSIEAHLVNFAKFCADAASSGHRDELRKLEVKLDKCNRARHRKILLAEQEAKSRAKLEKIIREANRSRS